MQIEIRTVQCFVALAEKLNFSIAASSLNMTQPTLSAQIKRLEDVIGSPLFVRTTRKVEMSELGQEILPAAIRLVDAQHDFQTALRTSRSTARIGTPFYTTGIAEKENLLRQFEVECPGTLLDLKYAFKQQILSMIDSHTIDLALLISFPVERAEFNREQLQIDRSEIIVPDDLPRITLARRPVLMAVPEEHPLAQYDDIPLHALQGHEIGMLDAKHGEFFTKQLQSVLESGGAHVHVPVEAHALALELYVRERRVPVISLGWFGQHMNVGNILYKKIEGISLWTELALIRARGTPNSATLRLWKAAERFAARNPEFARANTAMAHQMDHADSSTR
jgi:DNA-binding transcriptional LysR family regulator